MNKEAEEISKALKECLRGVGFYSNTTYEEAKEVVSDQLSELVSNKAIEDDYKVESELVYKGWRYHYPSTLTRVIAYLTCKIFRLFKVSTSSYKIRWYHHLLPFKIEKHIRVLEDGLYNRFVANEDNKYDLNEVKEWIEENAIVCEEARILLPYRAVNIEATIRPVKALESLNCSVSIGGEIHE